MADAVVLAIDVDSVERMVGEDGAVDLVDGRLVTVPGALVSCEHGDERLVLGRADAAGVVRPVHERPLGMLLAPYMLVHPAFGSVVTYAPWVVWSWLDDGLAPYPVVLWGQDTRFGYLYLRKGLKFPCLRDDGIAALL